MSKKGNFSDAAGNRIRRINTEIRRVTKKMNKLLARPVDKGGIHKNEQRHKGLLKHIKGLEEALKAAPKPVTLPVVKPEPKVPQPVTASFNPC